MDKRFLRLVWRREVVVEVVMSATAQVNVVRIYSATSTTIPPSVTSKQKQPFSVRVRQSCASSPSKRPESRRRVSISLLLLQWLSIPQHSIAASIFDKYVKRKKLDPLEAYVPAVILTQLQIKDLGKTLEVDQPQFAACRNILRYGPAASLRVNIRAVAQYASDSGSGKTAFNSVDLCLRALEELDSLLLHASRNDPEASVESMKAKIDMAVDALDSLLETVPSDVMEKGKAIADAYRMPEEEDVGPENLDPEIKQLESIL